MSTITTTLTAVTEPIKATAVDASSPTSISAYVASQEAHDADISDNFVPELNLIIGETNTVIGELNTLASGVSTNAATATTKAQLSADYAEKMAAIVETGTYSAKEHAIGDLTATGGSAKAWAVDASSPDGTTSKSAKTYAEEAAAAVATLPSGIINDSTITPIDTWSSSKINTELGGKQATLTFDTTPTDNSTNPVESGGVFDALTLKLAVSGGNLTGAVTSNVEAVSAKHLVTLAMSQATALCF